MRSGLQITEAWEQINAIDDALEENLDYEFHEQFGYLTACPTNVGTGIRVSVMLHLPALRLTNELEKVGQAARDMKLAVRGLHGEGTEAVGDGRLVVDVYDPALAVATGAIEALYSKVRSGGYQIIGDPTEGALVVAAAKAKLWRGATDVEYPHQVVEFTRD
jgi:hypothetical protein